MKKLRKITMLLFSLMLAFSMFTACSDGGGDTVTDAEAVASDKAALTITYGGSDTASSVTQNVILAASGSSGTTITWSSDNKSVIADDGSVTRPAYGSGDTAVTLTATITKGIESDTKAFALTVKEGNTGDKVTLTVNSVSFKVVYVESGMSFKTKTDDSGTDSVANAYLIGETEVTYELWYLVRTWAIARGYTFANAGLQGSGSGTNQHPVTSINWRDAMVWCNALTEYYNDQNGTSLTAVYYSNSGYTILIKDSSDGSFGSSVDSTAGSFDNPYVKSDATGFRLPTLAEWSLAARYKGSGSANGAYEYPASSGKWWTPGNYASGATADYNDATATGLVAVYFSNSGSSTAAVNTKTANMLGLYDMSGNVSEWNFDWHSDFNGSERVIRGGSWLSTTTGLQVGNWLNYAPYDESYTLGFRFARTP